MAISRRQLLQTAGGIGIGSAILGGAGIAAFSGGAAAQMSTSFEAVNPGVVKNDSGQVSEVFVAPRVYTEWENLDEVPLKLRYILEAGVQGTGYKPVYRETPWLFTDGTDEETAYETATEGTTGRVPNGGRSWLLSKNSAFYNLNANGRPKTTPPKIVLYKEGMSDYYDEPSDYPDAGGGTGEQHWTGASLGDDSGAYANGNYGVLGDTSQLDQPTDGESNTTTVALRLSTVLLDYDSESIMQDEFPAYSGSAGYTYERLRNIAGNNPVVSVDTTSFDVDVTNESAGVGGDADANAGVN